MPNTDDGQGIFIFSLKELAPQEVQVITLLLEKLYELREDLLYGSKAESLKQAELFLNAFAVGLAAGKGSLIIQVEGDFNKCKHH
jgi:hypothetical protein